jgi:hypothetical protein
MLRTDADHFAGPTEPFSLSIFLEVNKMSGQRTNFVQSEDHSMEIAAIGLASCIGLFFALRFTLRTCFPPDRP